jgi:hypothetical protein
VKTNNKLREALETILKVSDDWRLYANTMPGALDRIYELAQAALAAPPRNCDRPATVEDARRAYEEYRSNYIAKASNKFDLPMEFEPWLFALATEKGKTDGD